MNLFSEPVPPSIAGIDLRCGDVADTLSVRGASLVHADPPWSYSNQQEGCASGQYDLCGDPQIAQVVADSYECAAEGAHLILWTTWPKLGEWVAVSASLPWRLVSGGCWTKANQLGVGYHWRGDCEPILLYVKGRTGRPREALSNSHVSKRGQHSEKPVGFLRGVVRAFTPPDGLVLDLYAGLAPMARACAHEGRQYVGAEIDETRHRAGMSLLRQHRTEVL